MSNRFPLNVTQPDPAGVTLHRLHIVPERTQKLRLLTLASGRPAAWLAMPIFQGAGYGRDAADPAQHRMQTGGFRPVGIRRLGIGPLTRFLLVALSMRLGELLIGARAGFNIPSDVRHRHNKRGG